MFKSSALAFLFFFESFFGVQYQDPQNSVFNPNNLVLRTPTWRGFVDLRPEAKIKLQPRWEAIFRPRFIGRANAINGNWESAFAFQFDEASVHYSPSDTLQFVAGVHYYQWGPGEFFSPSNPFIHFQLDQRSVIFRQQGRVLLRASRMIGSQSSLDVLVEPLSNNQTPWIAGEPFAPKFMFKGETAWGAGNSLGGTLGSMDRQVLFCGEYFNLYLSDSVSLYFDGRQTIGAPTYYPSSDGLGGYSLQPGTPNQGDLHSLFLTGLRHEGFLDTRLEYLFNSYGYSSTQDSLGRLAAAQNPALLGLSLSPGLELRHTHYLYASIRTDKLGKGDELRIALRYLHSLTDGSGSVFSAIEWSVGERWTLIMEPMFSHGGSQSEFSATPKWSLFTQARLAL